MNVWSFEGVVREDQIKLPPNVHLPDETKVTVIVQTESPGKIAHVYSPRLVNPAQAADFVLEVTEESSDA
jgi:hypothetical protein